MEPRGFQSMSSKELGVSQPGPVNTSPGMLPPSITEANKKRKGSTSAKQASMKKQKKGSRKDARRKTEIKKQLGNMGDWSSMRSQDSEYTEQQRRREEGEYTDAKLVLGSKYTSEGREQCFGNEHGNELGRIEGMSTTIRDYQTVGVAFMVRQERSRNDCPGGIIADDMGIGKTVQSIGCMLANPPSMKAMRAKRSTTLIVVPNRGLGSQWGGELGLHGNISPEDICIYSGGVSALSVAAHPYVYGRLTTYRQIEIDFRSAKKGPLFQVEFFRILLDEGDNIRNYNGSTSKACAQLKAKLKWVLSGTPLRNSTKESLPYFRFLGIDVREKLESFVEKWGRPESGDVHDRTMQILAKRMLRREAGQMFLGRKMCEMPQSHIRDKLLPLTEGEKTVSRYLQQAMLRVEEEAREKQEQGDGDEDKNGNELREEEDNPKLPKSNFWHRTNRLRQAVDHPFLLENCIREFMNPGELDSLIEELEKVGQSDNITKSETPSSPELLNIQPGGLSIYEIALDIKAHINEVRLSQNNAKNGGCVECFTMGELQSLECGHAMCSTCLKKHIGATALENKRQLKCSQCGKIVAYMPDIKEELDDRWPSGEELVEPGNEVIQTPHGRSVSVSLQSLVRKRSPGDDFNGVQPRFYDSSSRWLRKCDEKGLVTASTKTRVAIQTVIEWRREAPDDQIVIFTEWIATAKVLGRMLNSLSINFVYYNGQITVKNRDKNLNDFKDNLRIKVMIATTGAANTGLNIANANRMIIMNPWWNHAAEAQAFGRIKRHGQIKETYLIRLYARDTIDERIYKLQNDKKAEIRGAMSQGKRSKPFTSDERRWLLTDWHSQEGPLIELGETTGDDDSDYPDE
ncbi:P-loop containing nucleoside triphosphate hydrolase protein [Xylaria arbuscula]|nr:P-loop containing nucleoside triphosphate hydrolase protein [Xylaria arbuscula]